MNKLTSISLSLSILGPLSILGSTIHKVHKTNFPKNEIINEHINIQNYNSYQNDFSITPDYNNTISFDTVTLNPRLSNDSHTDISSSTNSICHNYNAHKTSQINLKNLLSTSNISRTKEQLLQTAPYLTNGDDPSDYYYSISLDTTYSYDADFHDNTTVDGWEDDALFYPKLKTILGNNTSMYVDSSFGSYKDFPIGNIAHDPNDDVVECYYCSGSKKSDIYCSGIKSQKFYANNKSIIIDNFDNDYKMTTNFNNINLSLSDNFYFKINFIDLLFYGCEQYEIFFSNITLNINSINFIWHHI